MSKLFKRTWFWVVVGLVVIIAIWIVVAASKKSTYQTVTVKRGSVTETVSVTGNTTSTQNVTLAFQAGGTIANVNVGLGDRVSAGETIASVNTSDLQAQLAQAQASVDAAQATLAGLVAGPRAQDIAVSQAALATAQQNLLNTYLSVQNTLADADTKAVDAVVNQLAPFFTNPQGSNPTLSFNINDSQLTNNIQSERVAASAELATWDNELGIAGSSHTSSTLDTMLQNAETHLNVVKTLLGDAAQALIEENSLSVSTAVTYKNNATAGLNESNAAATEVSTAIQTIAAQKAAIAQAEAALAQTSASSTPQDIAAQQAQVAQAQANVQSIQAKISEGSIISPMSGVITEQDAKVGQIAPAGVPLVTILGAGGFEVDAYVPEVDIGKVAVGDPVAMTLDAFPGETFDGSVTYINPAETPVSGVVDYLVKIDFSKPDARIKSGFTVNCDISTQTDNNVLILPQYAIIQNDQGTFVETLDAKKNTVQTPVTLGIQDESGNVEITSGVIEGEQVVNIGLK